MDVGVSSLRLPMHALRVPQGDTAVVMDHRGESSDRYS
jgi:hypothetical protein